MIKKILCKIFHDMVFIGGGISGYVAVIKVA